VAKAVNIATSFSTWIAFDPFEDGVGLEVRGL
jgi:hypothetical protein